MLSTRPRAWSLLSLMRGAGRGRGGAAAFSAAARAATPPPHTRAAPPSARRALGYLSAGVVGGCAIGLAAAAARQQEAAAPGRRPRPSPSPPWAAAAGLGPPSPPAPGARPADDDDDAEEAAALAAVAASLDAWPLPTGKLACALRRPRPPAPPSPPPRPAVLVAAGAFNPPTIAHLRMVEVAADALRRQGVDVWGAYLSPVGDGYADRKPGCSLAPAHHRVAMCEAAAARVPGLAVDAWEALEGAGGAGGAPTRTLHVLKRVAAGLERAARVAGGEGGKGASQAAPRVVLVCGSDLLASLATPGVWKASHIAALGGPDHGIVCVGRAAAAAAVGRGGGGGWDGTAAPPAPSPPLPPPPASALAEAALAPGGPLASLAPFVTCVADPADLRGVSSSLVRAGLASGAPVRWLAPEAVLEHAAAHGLYGPTGAGLGGVSAGGGEGREVRRGPAAGTDA